MSIFKSSNPILKEDLYQGSVFEGMQLGMENTMTVQGTLRKFGILLLLTTTSAIFSWKYVEQGNNPLPFVLVAVFGGLALSFAMYKKPEWSNILAPIYALIEGLFVGAISVLYEYKVGGAGGYSGIVFQAVGLTLTVAFALYLLYHFRVIRVTQKFRSIVIMASVGLGLFYLLVFIASLIWGGAAVPSFINGNSAIGIGFSVLVVLLASFRLLVDFDTIEQCAEARSPKHYEWYTAFGLLVTLVWLYIEILRLLAKLSSRD